MAKQTSNIAIGQLVLRVGAGALMLVHGIPKMMMLFSGNPIQFPDPIGLGVYPSLILTVIAQVVCSVLVILGVATRVASIPIIFSMLVAFFVLHANDPFQQKELALVFALMFSVILIMGGGKYSLRK